MWSLLIDILCSYILFRKGSRPMNPLAILFFTLLVLTAVVGAIIRSSKIA